MSIYWHGHQTLSSRSYTCGYCGNFLAANQGYPGASHSGAPLQWFIYICHSCWQPTYFGATGRQFPGAPFGQTVQHLPTKEIQTLYDEARLAVAVNAYTGSVLCSRKLLMNIAVSKGAAEGLSFIDYVNYLANKGYVPPDGKDWVDHIRTKGNEATHQIAIMTREDAEDLITFVEALLKFIYEYPGMIAQKKKGSGKP